MPLSETEKHGVSTSGRRVSDKVENVPIKKRRFLMRSPSPPTANTVDHTESRVISEKVVPSDVISDAKESDKPDERLGEDEDFCGISILAAAACSSSLGRDCGYAEDGLGVEEESSVLGRIIEASTATEPLTSSKGLSKEDVLNSSEISSGATSSCISTEPVGELASISIAVNSSQKDANVGKILKADSSTFSGDISCSKDEELVRNPGMSSRDERLHWDLNVVMDAWEQPFDDLDAQNDVTHNISEEPGKVDRTEENNNVKNNDIDACLNLEQFPIVKDKSLKSNSNLNFDVMKSTVENTTYKTPEESINPTDGLAVDFHDETHVSASCTMIEPEGTSLKSLKLNDGRSDLRNLDDAGVSDAALGVVSANTHFSLRVSSSSDNLIKLKLNVGTLANLEVPEILHHEGNNLVENADVKTLEPQEHSEFALSDDNGLRNRDPHDSMPKRSCELQEGYDSQYEDGEFREPSGRPWEEYDRETENVEYASKYKRAFSAEPSEYHVSDSVQEVDGKNGTSEVGTLVSSDDRVVNYGVYARASEGVDNDKRHDEGNHITLSHSVEKADLSQRKEVLESSKSFPDMSSRGADDNDRKGKMRSSHIDRSLDSGGIESRTEPRAFKRSLQSQVEGPVARGDISRDEQIKKMDNRYPCFAGYE